MVRNYLDWVGVAAVEQADARQRGISPKSSACSTRTTTACGRSRTASSSTSRCSSSRARTRVRSCASSARPASARRRSASRSRRALGRRFVRVALGGVRDEAEIRGHRRTYIGSMPGRILQSLRRAGSKNPVFLLDEIDKLGADYRGDPAAALLEVLDPEQNHTFNDHYLEVDFDLSQVMFICTANIAVRDPAGARRPHGDHPAAGLPRDREGADREAVPGAEADRCGGARPRRPQDLAADAARDGVPLRARPVCATSSARSPSCAARSRARRRPTTCAARSTSRRRTSRSCSARRASSTPRSRRSRASVWPTVWRGPRPAATCSPIEVTILPGKGDLLLTGKLGDVMRESGQAAMSYARGRAAQLGLDKWFYRDIDVHVHVPEGAMPKDGPSAGITIASALVRRAHRNRDPHQRRDDRRDHAARHRAPDRRPEREGGGGAGAPASAPC